MTCKINGNRGL